MPVRYSITFLGGIFVGVVLTGTVLHEVAWYQVLAVLFDVREHILLSLPELVITGSLILILYTVHKFPKQDLSLLTAHQGVEVADPAVSKATTILTHEIDFGANPSAAASANDQPVDEANDNIDESAPSPDLDVIPEARLLYQSGKTFSAIALLNEALRKSDHNLDKIVLELLKIYEMQFSDPDNSGEKLDVLYTMRDQLLEYLSRKIRSLSSETWFRIYEKYPEQMNLNARYRLLGTA